MVTLERARPEHLPGIAQLLRDDMLGKQRESDSIDDYRGAFDQIDRDPNQHVIVGVDNDQVVAVLQLTIISGLTLSGAKRAQIEGVRVADESQGSGIGTQLVEYAIEIAKEEGCGVVQLTTNRVRTRALGFYESLGFVNTHNGMKLYLDPRLSPAGTRAGLTVGSVVIRVDDLELEATFWERALDYVRRDDDDEDFVLLRPKTGSGTNISLDRWHADLQIPPKIHLDLYAGDQAAEVERLVGLGATKVEWDGYPPDADYVILADPEGNRFCVIA